MLKCRVMPTLLFKDLGLVKGVRFDSWRPVGSVMQAIKVYSMREVDELVFLDIRATLEGRSPDFDLVDDIADECRMPLTVGGGVRSLDDVRRMLRVGADKVALGSSVVTEPGLIREMSERFGSQCVVVSIDARRQGNDGWEVYTHSGTRPTDKDPVAFALEAEDLGAGEILLTSIDRDGTMSGYDVALTRRVCDAVSIPVIASGGAGCYGDMADVVEEGHASAVAAASMFHFTQQTPIDAKRFLAARGVHVRL